MSPGSSETILVVDDEDPVRTMMSAILRSAGYQVLEASTGQEALELVAGYAGTIHLLLTDIVLPDVSGNDLAVQVLRLRPGLQVLRVSGMPDQARLPPELPAAGSAFLAKPFTPQRLLEKVREILAS